MKPILLQDTSQIGDHTDITQEKTGSKTYQIFSTSFFGTSPSFSSLSRASVFPL